MRTHRFTVNVPNPTKASALVQLELKPATLTGLKPPLDVPRASLRVVRAGVSLDPCAGEGRKKIRVRLKAYTSVDVYVTAVTADPRDPRVGGAVALNLVDRRGGRVAGGVMLACVDRPGPEAAAKVIATPRPCPVALARTPYAVDLGGHPKKDISATLPLGAAFTLVAPITNPRSRDLQDVTVYLEHTGASGANFIPAVWNVGTLNPRQVFYATWTVMSGASSGGFSASIVVQSQRADPTRLTASLRFGERRER